MFFLCSNICDTVDVEYRELMRNDHHLTEALRRKGYSYNAIAADLGMAKSTLSVWFGGMTWSEDIRLYLDRANHMRSRKRVRALARAQKAKWEVWREGYRVEARARFPQLTRDPLFFTGVMLYWGEGDSKSLHLVRLANTDPRMVKLFVNFLTRCCGVPSDRIKADLFLYPDLGEERERQFWSRRIGIPQAQFCKSQVIQSRNFRGLHPSKRLEHGICSVRVNSRGLKEQLRVWQNLCYQYILGNFSRA